MESIDDPQAARPPGARQKATLVSTFPALGGMRDWEMQDEEDLNITSGQLSASMALASFE